MTISKRLGHQQRGQKEGPELAAGSGGSAGSSIAAV